MAGNQTSKKKLEVAARRQRAVELRKQGYSYREIADALRPHIARKTYYGADAYKDVRHVLDGVAETMHDDARAILEMQLMQLQGLLKAWYGLATAAPVDAARRRELALKFAHESLLGAMQDVTQEDLPEGQTAVDARSAAAVSRLANAILRVVDELRSEGKPDPQAAKIVLDVLDRQAKLLNLGQMQTVNVQGRVQMARRDPLADMLDELRDADEEELEAILANLGYAAPPTESDSGAG